MRRMLTVALWLVVVPSGARAQTQPSDQRIPRAKLVAINMAIGGLTSGIIQTVAGRSFWKGFAKGSAGGALVYGGKCLIAQRSSLGYWLGREVVAVGSSVVRNASAGRGTFDELVLPVGPIWIYRDNKAGTQIAKVDVSQAIIATYFASQPRATFKAWKSFWSGGLIFDDSTADTSVEAAGVIRLTDGTYDDVLAHETVHVAQDEFMSIAWSDPNQCGELSTRRSTFGTDRGKKKRTRSSLAADERAESRGAHRGVAPKVNRCILARHDL